MNVYVIEEFSSDTNDWHLSDRGLAYTSREDAESTFDARIKENPYLQWGPSIRTNAGGHTGECELGIRTRALAVVVG